MTPARLPHVHIMNDNALVGESLRLILEHNGYCVSTTPLVLNREHLEETTPDVILIDVVRNEPSMAWELLTMLRLDRSTRTLPIVLCTPDPAYVSVRSERLTQLNVTVLGQSFTIRTLLTTLAQVMDDRRTLRNIRPYVPARRTTRLSPLHDATWCSGSAR